MVQVSRSKESRAGVRRIRGRGAILYHRQVLDPDQTRQLVASAAGGDRDAWDQPGRGVLRPGVVGDPGCGLYGAEASDVSQTVWLRFVEHIDRCARPSGPARGWRRRPATSASASSDGRAGRWSRPRCPRSPDPTTAEALVDALAAADDRGAVLVALGRIPLRCQELLRLMTVEPRLTYDDIAAALDVPRGWIGPTRGALPQPSAAGAAGRRRRGAERGRGVDADGRERYPPRSSVTLVM